LTDLLAVGVVRAAHGVKGELAVKCFSGDVERFDGLRDAVLRKGDAERIVKIESTRSVSAGILILVEGIDTREKALRLVGFELWVGRGYAVPLSEGEYYEADLCRCSVHRKGELIGRVKSVRDAGPNQLLEVAGVEGATFLVPFIDRFIGDVDVRSGRIELREEYIIR
jgi:16S rRNA processing protein RimM